MSGERTGGNFTRRRIATLILLKMLDSQGSPRGKVDAAVNYTDELLNRLKRGARAEHEQNQERGQNPQQGNRATARGR